MKYQLKAADTEWTIESVDTDAWLLTKKAETDCWAIGTYKSPTEAAVTVGAIMTAASRFGERHINRLRFVLSCWDVIEPARQLEFGMIG